MSNLGYSCVDTNTLSADLGGLNLHAQAYEAAEGNHIRGRRELRHEDLALNQRQRDRVGGKQLDLQRNSAIAGWTVRKHLDFTSTHNFDCLSEHKSLDEHVEGLIADWCEKEEFDIRHRLGLQDHIRMDEKQRTVRGDMLIQKTNSGHVQAIESDRIRNPDTNRFRGDWKNGTLQNSAGRITHYAIHRRTDYNGYEFERVLKAEKVYHYGYYMRHDQRRGISQMASAINHLRQAHDAIKYAQAKQIISQIFGVKMKKNSPNKGEIDLANGPFVAEVGLDEDVEIMSDNTPSKEFDSFLRHVISIIMKSLDLPYNFYDESHTNFFGSRAALNLYLMSCLAKRRGVRDLLNHLTRWRLNFEISRGNLTLPRGMSLKQFYRKHCEWIPIGVQWWNPKQEADAAEKLINLRLTTRSELRKSTHGDSWFSMMDRYDQEDIRLANSQFPDDSNDGGNQLSAEEIIEGVVERLSAMGIAG